MPRKIVECVPNISEGRDIAKIDAIVKPICSIDGVKLLSVESDADYNRTVITFAGEPEGTLAAAVALTRKAYEMIDMTKHHGEHPRMGAVDVCPFVPVSGVDMDDCVKLAHRYAKTVSDELGIPIYLYEDAAQVQERRNLAKVRKGEYEALPEKLKLPEWKPDYGPAEFVPRYGATAAGARFFLIAYNVNIPADNRDIAHEIALRLRESGRRVKNEKGEKIKIPGKLKAFKGIGVYLDKYHISQVSINLVNYLVTPPHIAFDAVRDEAKTLGVEVTGSELIGLIPLEAVLMAGKYALEKQGEPSDAPEDVLVRAAHDFLNLSDLYPVNLQERIIEYQV